MMKVIFDMDGVLYRGRETLPDAADCVRELRLMGAGVGFLTNNSARTREKYVEILGKHGIEAAAAEIMTSGDATIRYFASRGIAGKKVYLVGESGLYDTLSKAGFEVDISDEGPGCELVVVGWDRNFTFAKIARAQREIMVNGADLIATNADPTFPAAEGRILPGAGAILAAIETASGKRAEIIGKPRTISLKFLLEELGHDPGENPRSVWVVGDRLETDIACGKAYGARTVLVTSGIADRRSGELASPEMRPDFIIDSLSELPALVKSEL
jgi:phosphoglycolate/pyridoxal phosphate phosphatase family enzyme